jgi:hypothetical protein
LVASGVLLETCRESRIDIGVVVMNRAIEVWEGEGGAHTPVVSKMVHSIRHRTLLTGVVYAIAIVVVLAVVAKLY